jgi:hypothetical protein
LGLLTAAKLPVLRGRHDFSVNNERKTCYKLRSVLLEDADFYCSLIPFLKYEKIKDFSFVFIFHTRCFLRVHNDVRYYVEEFNNSNSGILGEKEKLNSIMKKKFPDVKVIHLEIDHLRGRRHENGYNVLEMNTPFSFYHFDRPFARLLENALIDLCESTNSEEKIEKLEAIKQFLKSTDENFLDLKGDVDLLLSSSVRR